MNHQELQAWSINHGHGDNLAQRYRVRVEKTRDQIRLSIRFRRALSLLQKATTDKQTERILRVYTAQCLALSPTLANGGARKIFRDVGARK